MRKRLALIGIGAAALVVAAMIGSGVRSHTTEAVLPASLQDFDVDVTQCLDAAGPTQTWPGNPGTINCATTEAANRGVGAAPNETLNAAVGMGQRQGLPFYYAGPGWQAGGDLGAGTYGVEQTGEVISTIDILCNGVVDVLASPAGVSTPEAFYSQPIVFTSTSGPGNTSELHLDSMIPGSLAMTKFFRQRADLSTIYLDGFGTPVALPLPSVTALNSVTLTPNWPQPLWPVASTDPLRVTTVILGGDPTAPSSTYTCQDAPQQSQSQLYGVSTPGSLPLISNPAAAGLYAQWATEFSAYDDNTHVRHIALETYCKTIGGVAIPDKDSDCLRDDSTAGQPDELDSAFSCTSDSNWDGDGDGLPDGIEAAWGTDPCNPDTDGDGRSDFEEMIGPAEYLTIPVDPDGAGGVDPTDTDNDGVVDGGYKVDGADAGMAPDSPDLNGNGTPNEAGVDGREVQVSGDSSLAACVDPITSAQFPCYIDGTTHTRQGYLIIGIDIAADGAGNDNCPSIPNPAQTNTDLDAATQMGGGDYLGDACDNDDDQDGMVDGAEDTFVWDEAGTPYDGSDDSCGVFPQVAKVVQITELTADIDATVNTNIGVLSSILLSAGPPGDIIQVGNELMEVTNIPNATHIDVNRGVLGTIAVAHKNGDVVSKWNETFLNGAITGPPTPTDPIHVDSTVGLTAGDTIRIDNELILIDNVDSGTQLDVTRGYLSVAAAHADDSPVGLLVNPNPTGKLDADTDGDGILDGHECSLASNPQSAASVPPPCAVDSEVAVQGTLPVPDLLCGGVLGAPLTGIDDEEINFRTDGFNAPAGSPPTYPDPDGDGLIGDLDSDSDGDGLSDACEVMFAGTEPMAPDTDEDGIGDAAETIGGSAGAPGYVICSAPQLQYDKIASYEFKPPSFPLGKQIDDLTVPNAWPGGGRTADTDEDGLLNGSDPDPADDLQSSVDYKWDDNGDRNPASPYGSDGADDGPSWDTDGDAIRDGQTAACAAAGSTDTDGDGLKDKWEVCTWGTDPNYGDSDLDGLGDCYEVVDNNGDGSVDFGVDALNNARAALVAGFGIEGDFDVTGDASLDYGVDSLFTARASFGLDVDIFTAGAQICR